MKKKNVALEVAKYKNLFDDADPAYCDKKLEKVAWKKVAEQTDLNVDTCKDLWSSLKRSAKYYAKTPRDPFKSGAGAGDEKVQKKYKDKWQFADVMSFYTPPALRNTGSHVSIHNLPATSSKKDSSNIDLNDSASDADSVSTANTASTTLDGGSVYVSILSFHFCIYLFSFEIHIYMYYVLL